MAPTWSTGRVRFLLLAGALLVLCWWHAWTDAWHGDFWIYVATVSELAARPFHPVNPLFGNEYPFAFLSPYTWVLGIASRLLGLRPFSVVVAAGLVNLLLLLAALLAFTATWLRRPRAAFYTLLFVLFLWGREPWEFSCFFHLRSLLLVLPYPSTLAAVLAFATLAVVRHGAGAGRWRWLAAAVPVLVLLWIIHPVNAVFLLLGLFACSLETARPWRLWLAAALLAAVTMGLALAWPLFPVAELWSGQIERVHAGNDTMYDQPLRRVGPGLLGVPFLLLRLRRERRDPLAVLALMLGAAVLYGWLSEKWSYGRLISHAVILLHLALADAVAALEERIGQWRPVGVWPQAPAVAIAACLLAVSWTTAIVPTIEESGRGDPLWLSFLESRVGRDDVVLTDLETSWHVPAFRGKVVAYPMQLPFVPDHAERLAAEERFFARGASREDRLAIIRRYRAAFVLFGKAHFEDGPARLEEIRPLGRFVYANRDYELLRVGE